MALWNSLQSYVKILEVKHFYWMYIFKIFVNGIFRIETFHIKIFKIRGQCPPYTSVTIHVHPSVVTILILLALQAFMLGYGPLNIM